MVVLYKRQQPGNETFYTLAIGVVLSVFRGAVCRGSKAEVRKRQGKPLPTTLVASATSRIHVVRMEKLKDHVWTCHCLSPMDILDPIGFCLAEVCDPTFHSAGLVLSVKLRPDQCAAIVRLQTGKLDVAQLLSEQQPLLERSSLRPSDKLVSRMSEVLLLLNFDCFLALFDHSTCFLAYCGTVRQFGVTFKIH